MKLVVGIRSVSVGLRAAKLWKIIGCVIVKMQIVKLIGCVIANSVSRPSPVDRTTLLVQNVAIVALCLLSCFWSCKKQNTRLRNTLHFQEQENEHEFWLLHFVCVIILPLVFLEVN